MALMLSHGGGGAILADEMGLGSQPSLHLSTISSVSCPIVTHVTHSLFLCRFKPSGRLCGSLRWSGHFSSEAPAGRLPSAVPSLLPPLLLCATGAVRQTNGWAP